MNSMRRDVASFDKPSQKRYFSFLSDGRIKDILIIGVLAFILTFAVWKAFYTPEDTGTETVGIMNESERKISQLLSNIDGVGKAEVIISENEDGIIGAVVVCEGANNISVLMDVREAVATALNIKEKDIKIYLKKQ